MMVFREELGLQKTDFSSEGLELLNVQSSIVYVLPKQSVIYKTAQIQRNDRKLRNVKATTGDL